MVLQVAIFASGNIHVQVDLPCSNHGYSKLVSDVNVHFVQSLWIVLLGSEVKS
jgi:hypothetical protein